MAGRGFFLFHRFPAAMPYSKVEGHDECDEGQIAVVKDEDGEVMGCHESEEAADEQLAALHAAEEEDASKVASDETIDESHVDSETIVRYGGEVKAMGDGRVGGYLVRFSSPEDPDLENDFFSAETDFGSAEKSDVYYHHGLDATLKRRGLAVGTLKTDEVGVWVEAQLELRDAYEEAIYQLAQEGKLGWSSGTARHLVERERKDGAFHIKKWPLGLDASLTPTPAEPRNEAVPLKSIRPTKLIVSLPDSQGGEVSNTKSSQAESLESGDEPETATATGTDGERPINVTVHVQSPATKSMSQENEQDTNTKATEAPEASRGELLEEYKSDLITKNEYLKATGRDPIGDDGDRYYSEIQKADEQKAQGGRTVRGAYDTSPGGPNLNTKTGLGDNPIKAFGYWVKTGIVPSSISHMVAGEAGPEQVKQYGAGKHLVGMPMMKVGPGSFGTPEELKEAFKADQDLTLTSGSGAVPTGHFEGIVAKRDEMMLRDRLGVRVIPGQGTSVNVPVEDDTSTSDFQETGEGTAEDRDTPGIDDVTMTLKRYTKAVPLTYEMLEDEEARLMNFLNGFVGRKMATTQNGLLITEVAANGRSLKTFDSATAIADGEIEDIEADDTLGNYLEDGSVAFVTRNSTLGKIRNIAGDDRVYAVESGGGPGVRVNRELIGYTVHRSNKVDAIGAGNKSIYFGNWNFVGYREAPGFTILRDPYSQAANGKVVFHYWFRAVYAVLLDAAIGYAEHPTA